jgi:hypothetical protein
MHKILRLKNISYQMLSIFTILFLTWVGSSKADETSYQLSSVFHSRYITEGRDNLSQDGAVFYSADAATAGWNFSALHVQTFDDSYRETDFSLAYSFEVDNWTITPTYTWFYFSQADNSKDEEVGLSIEYNNDSSLYHLLDWYFSNDAGGSFYTWQSGMTLKVSPELNLEPYLQIGSNHGYITDEHNDLNYYAIGINAIVQIQSSLQLNMSFNKSNAIGKQDGDTLDNLDWFSIGINYSF